MELKKTPKADLQNKRGLFLEIGLAVTLLAMIGLFRWNQGRQELQDMGGDREIVETEMVEITFEEQKPPEVQQQVVVQTTFDILNIVSDDRKIENTLSFADFDETAEFVFEPAVTTEEVVESDEPFMRAETMPTFQGGDLTAFRNWVQKNMTYPAMAQENGISGTVTLSFVVERDGSVTNIEALQSPDRSLSEAAIKQVSSSPKWTPGAQRGVPVRIRFILPVNFVLEGA